tara:strand:+ start:323 stop:742 length:420 start_codon:yes stop_codon:yes gene_type:complete
MTVINIIAKNKIIRLYFKYIFIIFVSILYFSNPGHSAVGDTYTCEKIQAVKITENIEKITFKSFNFSWLEKTIQVSEGPIFNNYKYTITYENKNSFTAANSTLAAIIRFSETQKAAYLSFTFSTPFSVTTLLAKCQKLT